MADTKRTTTILNNYYHFHHELRKIIHANLRRCIPNFRRCVMKPTVLLGSTYLCESTFSHMKVKQCLITTLQPAYTLQPAAIKSWLREADSSPSARSPTKLGIKFLFWNSEFNLFRISFSFLFAGLRHIFKKHFPYFFNTFSIQNEKTLTPSLIFLFPKYYSWNAKQKISAKLSSAVKNKILINNVAEFGISILFQ